MKKILTIVLLILLLISCNENERTRHWGGIETIDLPAGQKVINVTWKESDLWILTEPMDSSYVPKSKTFQQKKDRVLFSTGDGKVIIIESK